MIFSSVPISSLALALSLLSLSLSAPSAPSAVDLFLHFEIWEADLPDSEILGDGALPLPSGPASANLSGVAPTRP
jgi:hypothetical protein